MSYAENFQISDAPRKRGRPPGARDKSPRRPRFGQPAEPPNPHQIARTPRKVQRQDAQPVLGDVPVERPEREQPQVRAPPQQYGWKKRRWAELVGLGLSSVNDLIRCGEIKSIKLGPQLVLVVTSPHDWITRKLAEQAALPPGELLPQIPRRRRRPQVVQA